MPRFLRPVWILYAVVLSIFAVFSYSLTAPNLILSSWQPYWNFQTWMWQHFYNQRHDLTTAYLTLVLALFSLYALITYLCRNWTVSRSELLRLLPWWISLLIPLMLGYNALSYDIFNYIFNARMIVLYDVSPYQRVALDFAYDPWTRFMHNTHTFAPYGWGWTFLSVLGYLAGLGKFLSTWLIFKAIATLSFILLWVIGSHAFDQKAAIKIAPWLLLFLNPLMLLEFGLVGHNDLWMMIPAVASLLLVRKKPERRWGLVLLFSALLLGLSILIKLATATLLPLWMCLVGTWFISHQKIRSGLAQYWPVLACLSLSSLLLHPRSQYFHPWYLSWALVWLPFFPKLGTSSKAGRLLNLLTITLISLSFTSLLRYVPWLLTGEYPPIVIYQQRLITGSGVLLGVSLFSIWQILETWRLTKAKNR